MRTIRLISQLDDRYCDSLAGTFLDDSFYDTVIQGDADVFKPDGSPLIKYRAGCLSKTLCEEAREALKELPLKYTGSNRGMAGGSERVQEMSNPEGRPIVSKSGTRFRVARKDGRVSNTIYAPPTPSAIGGYFERTTRYPYCRQTAFTSYEIEHWRTAKRYVADVGRIFSEVLPDRYAAQLKQANLTNPDFVITNTVFTTITVNRNWRTAAHRDAGDLPEGFGVMSVLERGLYQGGYLVFPRFRVAVDMRIGGVCFADVHEIHGNTAIVGLPDYERISVVFYFRKNMVKCGSAEEELMRAKTRRRGTGLFT